MLISLNPGCGLCNRLRTIMTVYYMLPAEQPLIVVWKYGKNQGVNGKFLDYFEPLPNVEFTTVAWSKPDYKGNGGDLVLPRINRSELYRQLKPNRSLQAKILEK